MSPEDRDRRPQLQGALAALIAVVLFVGVVAVIVDDESGVPASGARASVEGNVLVVHDDGSSSPLEDGDVVAGGEQVRVESGSVVLELASGAVIEGREGRDDVEGTRIVVGSAPQLVAGDLLVRGEVPLTVSAGGNDIDYEPSGADSAARLRRALSVTAGAYDGGLEVDSAGQARTVPALRQLSIASLGRPPATPEPLRIDATDEWDLRYLGVAFELTRRLDSVSRAFTANFGPTGATVETLETILPALAAETAFGPALLDAGPARPGGETLVAVSIALLGRKGDFASRLSDVRAFRDDGAEWGLVALDQGVADGPLVATVEEAYARAATPEPEVALGELPPAPPVAPTTTSAPPTTAPATAPPPTSTTRPSAPPSTLPPEPEELVTLPTLPPLPPLPSEGDGVLPDTGISIIDDLVDPIDSLLGGILGG